MLVTVDRDKVEDLVELLAYAGIKCSEDLEASGVHVDPRDKDEVIKIMSTDGISGVWGPEPEEMQDDYENYCEDPDEEDLSEV